jgi:hypothetical protein
MGQMMTAESFENHDRAPELSSANLQCAVLFQIFYP